MQISPPNVDTAFLGSLVGSLPGSFKMTSFYLKYVGINNLIDLFVHYEARNKNYPFLSFLAPPVYSHFTLNGCEEQTAQCWRPSYWCMLDKTKPLMTSWDLGF